MCPREWRDVVGQADKDYFTRIWLLGPTTGLTRGLRDRGHPLGRSPSCLSCRPSTLDSCPPSSAGTNIIKEMGERQLRVSDPPGNLGPPQKEFPRVVDRRLVSVFKCNRLSHPRGNSF